MYVFRISRNCVSTSTTRCVFWICISICVFTFRTCTVMCQKKKVACKKLYFYSCVYFLHACMYVFCIFKKYVSTSTTRCVSLFFDKIKMHVCFCCLLLHVCIYVCCISQSRIPWRYKIHIYTHVTIHNTGMHFDTQYLLSIVTCVYIYIHVCTYIYCISREYVTTGRPGRIGCLILNIISRKRAL